MQLQLVFERQLGKRNHQNKIKRTLFEASLNALGGYAAKVQKNREKCPRFFPEKKLEIIAPEYSACFGKG